MLCMKLLRRKLMRVQSSKVKAANRGLSKSQGLPGISGTATITITNTMTITITIAITSTITSTITITHVLPLLYISVTISIVMLRLLLPTTNIHDILNAEDIETVEVHLQILGSEDRLQQFSKFIHLHCRALHRDRIVLCCWCYAKAKRSKQAAMPSRLVALVQRSQRLVSQLQSGPEKVVP